MRPAADVAARLILGCAAQRVVLNRLLRRDVEQRAERPNHRQGQRALARFRARPRYWPCPPSGSPLAARLALIGDAVNRAIAPEAEGVVLDRRMALGR